jgi:adenosylcobyric acid synthase
VARSRPHGRDRSERGLLSARPILIGGTSSNAGKSWVSTALCAWLRRNGIRVAPFKAQNMSNHSYPCEGGGEIGRAQAVQAAACGLAPESAMNPILLKPNANGTSQVVVNGRLWKTMAAREYYDALQDLVPAVMAAYEDLARRFDVVVIEGAGSVSEINLRQYDIVNLGLATRIGAPWVLVADIERGGVFASVVGTAALVSAEERALLRGFLVNKFRGDVSLFDEGRAMLEARSGVRCLGIFPFVGDLTIDAEDSLALDVRARTTAPPGAETAVVRFPCLSNGTDLRLLTWADWIAEPSSRRYDVVILPGTKDTIADLAWLRARSLDRWVIDQHARGARVVGICGGFQMLGEAIADPHGMESGGASSTGLGLLPVTTVLSREKTTIVRQAVTPGGVRFTAYEIHLGVTSAVQSVEPFAAIDGRPEGARVGRVSGTYLHGALEDPAVCAELFGVPMPVVSRANDYARLADWFEAHAEKPGEWCLGA